VLSKKDVESIFLATKNLKHRAILMTTYSAGLRIGEATRLKVSDIDSRRMMIRVDQGKCITGDVPLLTRVFPSFPPRIECGIYSGGSLDFFGA
jgi:integrase